MRRKPAMADGKLAVVMVMPHGILFCGGEERAGRQQFIKDGILEAVIGLPTNLCHSTGIPACVLVINTNCAATRRDVLFINADREFREGKNQNALRAEDIEKIAQVHRTRQNLDKYSRVVSVEELERKDFNLSIRRDIDNSPPPEPHDVRAHLHGESPVAEIDALSDYFKNYEGVKDAIFVGWDSLPVPQEKDGQECPSYRNFTPTITTKDPIKTNTLPFKKPSRAGGKRIWRRLNGCRKRRMCLSCGGTASTVWRRHGHRRTF
jgi:hypothetical protein